MTERKNSKELLKEALIEIKKMRQKVREWESAPSTPIAVVGMSCRFAGDVDTPQKLWQMLLDKKDAVTEVPKERWNIDDYYDPDPNAPGKTYTRWGSFVSDADKFDASFFGIIPNEARMMDPQQRLILETAWEALEDGGQAPESWKDELVGVFLGISNNDYERIYNRMEKRDVDVYSGTGNTFSVASGRLSFLLGFQGPNVAIDTACSSSLVTVHMACQSLRNKECNMALAGGVSLLLSPEATIYFSKARMMSPDGRCKTFDAKANGYVRGEGCGFVVLKRLDDAIESRDNILAVIRGSAVNHDGKSSGLTVPNGVSQQLVIRNALQSGGVSPQDVSYVECHGTGTSLGDPIEIQSLAKVLGRDKEQSPTLKVGSIKTNIGHLEAAAGIAGLIKAVLCIQNKYLPAHLHFDTPSPHIAWDQFAIDVTKDGGEWQDTKRIAGVSSFGFSGTNSHVVVAEAPSAKRGGICCEENLFILSAKTQSGLDAIVQKYATYLPNTTHSLADICYTLQTGRNHFKYRLAIAEKDTAKITEALQKMASGETVRTVSIGKEQRNKGVVFLFTGQGSQYPQMAQQLYETHRVFRDAIDECAKYADQYLPQPLTKILYDTSCEVDINDTAITQPLLFCIEYALAQLWMSWGIRPAMVMGHSVGEFAAACVAGVFSVEDGIKLINERGRLMQSLPRDGSMVAIFASEQEVQSVVDKFKDEVSLATANGPKNNVISGNSEAISKICREFESKGVGYKKLTVSHAFHSPLMTPILDDFSKVAQQVTFHAPKIPLISNVSGKQVDNSIATPQYWREHIMATVRFQSAVEYAHEQGFRDFVEIGPSPTLIAMARRCVRDKEVNWLFSIRGSGNNNQQILENLGKLHVLGYKVEWPMVTYQQDVARVSLPTYAFQRKSFWLEGEEILTPAFVEHKKTTAPQEKPKTVAPASQKVTATTPPPQMFGEHCYYIDWQKTATPQAMTSEKKSWLVFSEGQKAKDFTEYLQQQGHEVMVLEKGKSFKQVSAKHFIVGAHKKEVFSKMCALFAKDGDSFDHVVYFWGVDNGGDDIDAGIENTKYVFDLTRAFVAQKDLAFTPNMWLVTQNACPVNNDVAVAQSFLWGIARGIAIEYPQWFGGVVDIDDTVQTDLLCREVQKNSYSVRTALRGETRYKPSMQPCEKREAKKLSLKDDATYMITGGLGAIGFAVAQKLAQNGAKKLLLVDCKSPDAKQQQQIDAWNIDCKTMECDLADTKQVQSLPQGIHGIFHAAGLLGDGLGIDKTTWEAFSRTLGPKVQGSMNLALHFPDVDFCVHFSSILTLYGMMGQSSYSTANAFQDAMAHHFDNHITINWGAWEKQGMAVESNQEQVLTALGANNFSADKGFAILENVIVQRDHAQVVATDITWKKFMLQFREDATPELFAAVIENARGNVQRQTAQRYATKTSGARLNRIMARLKIMASDLFGIEANEIEEDVSFLEMGGDSFLLIQIAQLIGEEFAVVISFQELIEDVNNLADLAKLIDEKLPEDEQQSEVAGDYVGDDIAGNDLEKILANQMKLMSQHLEKLRSEGANSVLDLQQRQLQGLATSGDQELVGPKSTLAPQTSRDPINLNLTEQQQKYLEDFLQRFAAKTATSKKITAENRHNLADRRTALIFRMETKEIIYPIIGEKSCGARIWDVDNNEYIDVSMGFGVHLFGHGADFLLKAIQDQLALGIHIGPQAMRANEVAKGIAEITGNERVAFCNTGTEAVMYAMRLARTVTNRRAIVMFNNSYHGMHDSLWGYRTPSGKTYPEKYLAGIPRSLVQDMVVLDYNDPASLDFIEANAEKIAGVMIEPVRSRSPHVQPREFLQKLRKITEDNDVPLIFDEVLVGFRLKRGGAQEWYDIRADIVTYGKIIGGGMPIGVVAGKSEYMDAVDGGLWQYGDDSFPEKMSTAFGGTFSKNPLTMAGAHAVIQYLKEQGPQLYDNLNQLTADLAAELNAYLSENRVPMKVVNCASIFRFIPTEMKGYLVPFDVDLFFHHMNYHGVYIWESRVCFMSTAHTKEDTQKIVAAVKRSVEDLRSGGFLLPETTKKIHYHTTIEKPKLRVFCFPYAGGGASLFRTFHETMPEGVEVVPIQYPGRENLIKEPLLKSVDKLVAEIYPDVKEMLDVPCVFLGYSLGALVAFEMVRKLRRENDTLPQELIVAAHRSPHLPDSTVQIHSLPDKEMVDVLRKTITDVPDQLWENEEMLKAYLPMIRADVTVSETYHYVDEEPLGCKILACGGTHDDHVSEEEILAWQKQTSAEFVHKMIEGTHFFLHDEKQDFHKMVANEMKKRC
ncbi:type I polyketide synthase [Candidatus Uabimicrobium amorphum]|uniref:Putative polyketide synthase n=1 Tax=Uabimicrobium amorphum TaxID=2596890 RepID=A0A5S9ITA2_UABAM|nr:type I polyketide synthase [Candidatus Uabimicrobium amorphum]BBM86750.1 putative polyketide synthase [Candidatus Uabimicrobium amorphum]